LNRLRAAIVIVSDRSARGERPDETAPLLTNLLLAAGFEVPSEPTIVPDELPSIAKAIRESSKSAAVVLTSGGTGIAPRDVTPEATRAVIDREIPGFGEAMRSASRKKTPFADLSRATAGTHGTSVVVNLPGSPKGAQECLTAVLPMLKHACRVLSGPVVDSEHRSG